MKELSISGAPPQPSDILKDGLCRVKYAYGNNRHETQSKFVQTLAELAAKPSYAEGLHKICAVEAVMSLVDNTNPSVRTNVVLILARLANYSGACVEQLSCSKNQLRRLLGQIGKENKHYRKYSMRLIKNISKYSYGYDLSLIQECGVVDAISICLNDVDVNVRGSALLAVSSIARHDGSLSKFIVNSGLLSPIIQCLTEKQQNLKVYALSALNEIAKHNRYLAQTVVDVKCLPTVIQMLLPSFTDITLQRSALALIKNIVKHSLVLSENALEWNLFSNIFLLMAHYDETIRNNAVKVVCEIVKKSVQIAQMVVNAGGIAALLNVITCSEKLSCTPAVLALGYIAAPSPIIALAIIQSKALIHLTSILKNHDTDSYTRAGAVWTLGTIGRHSREHARHINDCGAMTAMMDVYMDSNLENDSKLQCKNALRQILNEFSDDYSVLEKLLILSDAYDDPIMTFILDKISKILPKNTKARRNFIINGHLKMIQIFKPEVDSELFKVIEAVNCSFPENILHMVAVDFPEKVMKTVDMYVPKSQCLFNDNEGEHQKSYLSTKNPPLSG